MKSFFKKFSVLISLSAFLLSTIPVYGFSDVNTGNKYFVEISYLESLGLVNGYEDGTFKQKNEINRAEALKLFMEASKNFQDYDFENMEIEKAPFIDTPFDAWYTPYIAIAKEKGIIKGHEDGTFKPEQTINLVEALKIYLECYENINYPEVFKNHFADVDENAWYSKYLRYADEKDMIEIYPSNKIYPFANQNRGDIAGMIYRHIMGMGGGFEFGKATFYGKAVQGHYTASGEIFDLNNYTAAHKTLPFGSIVRVTNLANGKSIEVKITDRGPYGPGRIIDLTEAAFSDIAWLGTGVIHVQMEVLTTP
ncbi:MAG: septal ring lytic transglycosylase RlpA family protein [Candidatus Gracilibacteria bacterium]|jgi:rare lipoprotein A|nr:septal ring lytic transglycosylase RlpA family protein [Candidatus Gracilibacteria bacterium]